MKRAEGGVLGEVEKVRVARQRPVIRSRKKWSECVMEEHVW